MKNQLTALQRATLFAHVKNAAIECGEKPEDYRRRIMCEELGVDHLSEVSRTDGFDRLMCRMLKDCGEYSHALDYVGGDIKRLRYLATQAALAIVQQSREWPGGVAPAACRYIAGVMVQMRFSFQTVDSLAMKLQRLDGWDDFTDLQLKKVVSALQMYVRRHS